MNEFASRLRELRIKNGLTQTDIAKELGVTQNAIYRYEAGLSWPNMETLIFFADKYKCSADYLLGRTDVMGTPQRITVYPKENMDLSEIQKMINDYINKEDEKKEDEKGKRKGSR